jgi:hypothetical protein
MCSCKAPSADNGSPLIKDDNAAWAYLEGSLRAGMEGVVHGIASLEKGKPFPAIRALYLTPFRPAEPINITMLENECLYLSSICCLSRSPSVAAPGAASRE